MDINSVNQMQQLESLDSIRSNTYQNNRSVSNNDFSTSLESLDSIRSNSNSYYDPNMNIPQNQDLLTPMDYINPTIPQQNYEDTKEKGFGGFVGGVFKGFGKAGFDTVKGVVTLGKVVVGSIIHPKDTVKAVGGAISYAVSNPGKAIKNVAIDLPVGIVKGIVQPYGDAIKQGKYGEAVGRGVFDVGLILMTAGLGEEANGAKAGSSTSAAIETVDKVSDTAKTVDKVSKGAKATKTVSEGASVVTKGSTVKLAENAINISNVKGNVVINIGNTTANVTTAAAGTAGKVSRATKVAKNVSSGAKNVAAATEAVVATAETVSATGKISLGLSDLGNLLSKGASRIFKPIGGGLTSLIGEGTAGKIGGTLANGVSKIKAGALFVKQHPIATSLIAGKTVDIIDKGLKSSDLYQPSYDY